MCVFQLKSLFFYLCWYCKLKRLNWKHIKTCWMACLHVSVFSFFASKLVFSYTVNKILRLFHHKIDKKSLILVDKTPFKILHSDWLGCPWRQRSSWLLNVAGRKRCRGRVLGACLFRLSVLKLIIEDKRRFICIVLWPSARAARSLPLSSYLCAFQQI